jgi:hypothetical protein
MTKLANKISIHGSAVATKEIVAVARAAIRAGISEHQAILLARAAVIIAQRSDAEDLRIVADGIVRQARREHAANHPNGKWARLFARHGEASGIFMDANSKEARAWSEPHAEGTRAYYLELAAEAAS